MTPLFIYLVKVGYDGFREVFWGKAEMIGSADIIQETAVLGGFFRERGGLELQIHAALGPRRRVRGLLDLETIFYVIL